MVTKTSRTRDAEIAAFVASYTQALVAAWSDDHYAWRLEKEPHAALAEVGLNVPAGTSVVIETSPKDRSRDHAIPDEDSGLDGQIQLWEDSAETGTLILLVPQAPAMETGELGDDELSAVAGGMACCCCTPCSCCA